MNQEEEPKKESTFSSQIDKTESNEKLLIISIRLDGNTQPRNKINSNTVKEYAQSMKRGDIFPPVLVYFDDKNYWLADGFHRIQAAESIGQRSISATVRKGTQREAILTSVGANATHGLRRTNADKRRAVLILLEDEEWSKWTNVAIAKACGVAESFVRKLKKEFNIVQNDVRTYVTKHGTQSTMNVAKIGKGSNKHQEGAPMTTSEITGDKEKKQGKAAEISGKYLSHESTVTAPSGGAKKEQDNFQEFLGNLENLSQDQIEAMIKGLVKNSPTKFCNALVNNVFLLPESMLHQVWTDIGARLSSDENLPL